MTIEQYYEVRKSLEILREHIVEGVEKGSYDNFLLENEFNEINRIVTDNIDQLEPLT